MKAKKDQLRRFLEAAREYGADDTGAELERAFRKIVPPRPAPQPQKKPPEKRRKD